MNGDREAGRSSLAHGGAGVAEDAIFVPDGGRFVPTKRAGSPWGPGLLHGGPPAGLLARAIEHHVPDPTFAVTRLTIDLFRPVPMQPLEVRAETVREGNRIHAVQAGLFADDVEVSRATAVLLRKSEAQADPHEGRAMPPGPEGLATSSMGGGMRRMEGPPEHVPSGFHTTIEVRWVNRPYEHGPNMAWIRIPVPLVAGEPTSPLVRAAAVSDFGNAFANIGRPGGPGYINADITLYLHRLPDGEWVGMQAQRVTEPVGLGVATTTLYDHLGPIGGTMHALLANQRRPARRD